MPHPVNTADAAVAPDEPCCGDGWLCCDGACAPEALIEDMCDPQRADFLVAFGRGPSGCFGLGYSWGYSNSSGYGYTAAGEVRGCSRRTDGLAGEVGGDPEFSCPGVAEHCIVCAVDGPGVELENWLETTRWCDDSDDLPFSLDGIDRGDLGDASVMPGDTQ